MHVKWIGNWKLSVGVDENEWLLCCLSLLPCEKLTTCPGCYCAFALLQNNLDCSRPSWPWASSGRSEWWQWLNGWITSNSEVEHWAVPSRLDRSGCPVGAMLWQLGVKQPSQGGKSLRPSAFRPQHHGARPRMELPGLGWTPLRRTSAPLVAQLKAWGGGGGRGGGGWKQSVSF